MVILECAACGGNLVQKDKFWVCECCGTKFLVGQDANGNPFSYQPVDKKTIEGGKVAPKASSISVNTINVKEIVVRSAADEGGVDGLALSKDENLGMIPKMLEKKEWKIAEDQINDVLAAEPSCAEAIMYRMMCRLKIANNEQKVIKYVCRHINEEKDSIEEYLSVANEKQIRNVISLMFDFTSPKDEVALSIVEFILPYGMNEVVLSKEELTEKVDSVFDDAINYQYPQTFEYLLTNALDPTDVDKYIDLLKRYAKKAAPNDAQKYYNMILAVDCADIETLRNMFTSDLACNYPCDKCIADFENLLCYSTEMNDEVVRVVNQVSNVDMTTENQAELMWKLLGYHPEAPEIFAANILTFANACLHSSLWVQAKKYFSLLLSLDNSNGDAYWGLCMARFEMSKEKATLTKRKEIINSPEYKKAFALYQKAGNEKRVKHLLEFAGGEYRNEKIRKYVLPIVLFFVYGIISVAVGRPLLIFVFIIVTIIIVHLKKKKKNEGKF